MLVNQNQISISSISLNNHTASSKKNAKTKSKVIKGKEMESFQNLFIWWDFEEGNTIEKMFFSRRFRPNEKLKAILKDELIEKLNQQLTTSKLTSDDIELSWNKHCGCTMCPCSPGYNVYFKWQTILNLNMGEEFKNLKNIESVSMNISIKQ
jgi:hypothetical protein